MAKVPATTAVTLTLPPMELGAEAPTALYRLFDAHDLLLYVGISDNIKKRFRQHAAEKPWWPDVARRTVEWHLTRESAEAAEDLAIATERPVYNIQGAVRDVSPLERRAGSVPVEDLAELLDLDDRAIRLRLACMIWEATPRQAAAQIGMSRSTYYRAKRGLSA